MTPGDELSVQRRIVRVVLPSNVAAVTPNEQAFAVRVPRCGAGKSRQVGERVLDFAGQTEELLTRL